ncbi:MAG: DUF2232 domain-containing protein [Magnetococcales bacterium]|nr:DUF2232 domain-containing protein [Magnetococcales bacterium]
MLLQRLTGNPLLAGTMAALLLILPLAQIYLLFPLQFIVPLPIYLVALRFGIRAGALASGVPILFCFGILGQLAVPLILTFLVMIWFPLLAAWLTQGGWRPIQVLGGGYFLALLLLVLFLIGSILTGNDLMVAVHSQLMESKAAILAAMTTGQNPADAQHIVEMGGELDEAFRLFSLLFPAMFLLSWYSIQVGNFLLVRYLLKRWQMPLIAPQELSTLRIPFVLIWPLIVTAMLGFFTTGSLAQFGLNLLLFLAIPYFFQGYSVVEKGFEHYKVAVFIRGVFYIILMAWTGLIVAITVLGLFDTWMDFRKRLG